MTPARMTGTGAGKVLRMRRTAVIVPLLICLLALPATAAHADDDTATVTLVHGFRGLLADVYLDGQRILTGFAPERSTDPTAIPAGTHTIAVREADAPSSAAPVVEGTLELTPDANLSAVVHPDRDGEATISVFDNTFPAPGDNMARAVLRHTAAAPPVTVRVGNVTVADDLAPGDQEAGIVDPTADEVVTTDASSQQLLAPARIDAAPDATVALYLIGSADDDSLGWLSQRLDAAADAEPVAVPTGTGTGTPWWATAATVAALLLGVRLVAVARRLRRTPA
jgi:hypothetical protein